MQKVKPDRQQRLHASVDVYPKNTETLAAVSSATLAWRANTAVDVRVNRAAVPSLDALFVRPDLDHLARQFVSEHAGIGIGGVSARKGMEITATHTDSTHSDQRLTTGRFGGRELELNQLARCLEYDLPHEFSFSFS